MIRTIIIDDEELSIISLRKKLQRFPIIDVVKTYNSHKQLLSDLKHEKVDAIFLDIEMPGISGMDLSEEILNIQSSIQIVFVTAHSEYALQAFEINSMDYLLKPVTSNRLAKTIDRLVKSLEGKKGCPSQESHHIHLDIKCFNELQVFHQNKTVHFKTAKVKELFAFLLTHYNTYVNRDLIIEKLWPDQEYNKSKIYLHTCFSHLRKTLHELGYPKCITFSNSSYILSLDHFYCDAIEFTRIVRDLKTLDPTNIETAEKAVQLYTGSFLALNGFDWAYSYAQNYEGMLMDLLDKLTKYFQNLDNKK
ncbi:MAG TPA: response regulator, partial [Chondromyces sp.]|nr:response regulator [Chondromyces sp.]